MVDLAPSSSEENGSSLAVLKDSDREFVVAVLEAARSSAVERRALGRLVGWGGVTSGVGGLRWSGGVAGGRCSTIGGDVTVVSAASVVSAFAEPDGMDE